MAPVIGRYHGGSFHYSPSPSLVHKSCSFPTLRQARKGSIKEERSGNEGGTEEKELKRANSVYFATDKVDP